MNHLKVIDIREEFKRLYNNRDKDDDIIEIINANFIADEDVIFGNINEEYAKNEHQWYLTQSLNINDFNGTIPAIWKNISGENGEINSNYGWCVFSEDNFNQFKNVAKELELNKNSRRAILIYTRPQMHYEAFNNKKNDFICTNTTHFFIRQNQLYLIVNMRSNDAIYGFKYDLKWQKFVFEKMYKYLKFKYPNLEKGFIYWQVNSLHIYKKHFYILEELKNEICNY